MSIETNKALVERFYAEAINGRDAAACQRLLTEGFVHNGEQRGRDGQQAAVEYFLSAFSDLHNEIELSLGEGDLVAAHQRWTGTHDGEFLGVEPTGIAIDVTSTAILRVEGELLAQAWDEFDVASFLAQVHPDAG